jgi:hypothetical protein
MCKKFIVLISFLLVLGLIGSNVVFGDVIEIPVAAENDDVEERADGSMYFDSSDLELIYDNDPTVPDDLQTVGLRFLDVPIPKGATIASATVRFDADDVDDAEHVGDAYVIIEGELSPNAAAFEDVVNNVTSRARTAAQVAWGPAHWSEKHAKYETPDIAGIIQEIVNQDDWAAGNALVVILSQDPAIASTGVLEAESFKDNATENIDRRPTLLIEIAQDGPAAVETGHLYLLEEIIDGTVPDDSANDNAGNVLGDPLLVDSLNGKGLQLDGIDDGVHIPDSEWINTSTHTNHTVIAVFKCADVTKPEQQCVYEEGGSTRGLVIYVHEGLVWVGAWNRADYSPQWNPGTFISAPIESDQWVTVSAVLRDGGPGQEGDKFEMWMDGEFIGVGPGV